MVRRLKTTTNTIGGCSLHAFTFVHNGFNTEPTDDNPACMPAHAIRNPQQIVAEFVAEFAACIWFFSRAPHVAQRKSNQSIGQSVPAKRSSIDCATRGAVA
jgi:hypothetical protein